MAKVLINDRVSDFEKLKAGMKEAGRFGPPTLDEWQRKIWIKEYDRLGGRVPDANAFIWKVVYRAEKLERRERESDEKLDKRIRVYVGLLAGIATYALYWYVGIPLLRAYNPFLLGTNFFVELISILMVGLALYVSASLRAPSA